MIDLDDVRAFQKVATLLSFSAAGRVLGVRKSAVSRSIQRLETAFKVRLFERTTREVALTEAGRVMLERLEDVLVRLDGALDTAAGLSAHPQGRLKITAGIGFGIEILSELLPEFSLAYPDVALSLDLSSRIVDLVAEHVDVAFRMGPLPDSDLVGIRLGTISSQICASPVYLERRGIPSGVHDLGGHDLLAIPRPDGLPRRWCLRDAEGNEHLIDHVPRLTANDPHVICRMVHNGAGIAAIATFVAAPEIVRGNLVRVLPGWEVPPVEVNIVMPGGRVRSPAARAFVSFIRERAAGNTRWFDP